MPKKSGGSMLGGWSFLIGVILALVFGLMGNLSTGVTYVLVVLGIVIGLLNIANEEVSPFLMSGTVLVIVSYFGQGVLKSVTIFFVTLQALTMLFVPATIIVALKHVFTLARH